VTSRSAAGDDGTDVTPKELQAAVRADFEHYLQEMLPGVVDSVGVLRSDSPDVWSAGDKTMSVSELAEMLEAQIATASGPAEWGFRPEGLRWNLFAAAWRTTIRRQIRAVLELLRVGLLVELLPNARAAIEHAALLRALGDAVEASAQDSVRGMLSALERLDDVSGRSFAELLSAAQGSPVGEPSISRKQRAWSGDVKALFERVENGAHLYVLYRWLSASTHAGSGSAMPYLQRVMIEGVVTKEPVNPPLAEVLAALSWSCWTADEVIDQLLQEPALVAEQREAMARYGFDG
jgi:hypothetical protein